MKSYYILFALLFFNAMNAQQKKQEQYTTLPFGSITPSGWIKNQMEKDMQGFVGHLDELVPDLINDPIYGKGRLQKHSKAKDLGNQKEGDAEGDDQYKWWNSETQSNWWDGYLRNAILLNDAKALQKVKKYINEILATQDADGYLGIYDPELRYKFNSENGELWAKATLYRGLLAYYDYSKDPKVWKSLVKAVDNVMQNYPINASSPFSSGEKFNGGVSHGLTFTDVLDKMYQITKEQKYLDYALFLYLDYSKTYQSEKDAQLQNILNPNYKLQSHGVHTFEHLRPLIVATYAKNNPEMEQALALFLQRIREVTTITGGPIGDEWIAERKANATHTGYEYCSIHELLDSYSVLLQKNGEAKLADDIETIFYNAAQGSRNPNHSCIAYLKTDNSFEMMGTKNGEIEPDRKQTRYKYSATHQDVAVCCNPNAGRITPYFLEKSWLLEDNNTLVASLLGPSTVKTTIESKPVQIEEITQYPFENRFTFRINNPKKAKFNLKVRKPNWATKIIASKPYKEIDGFLLFEENSLEKEAITLEFEAAIVVKKDANNEKYFTYGAQVFALPFQAEEIKGRLYKTGFYDIEYAPKEKLSYSFIEENNAKFKDGKIEVTLKNNSTQTTEKVTLIPFGKTILRQVSF
ncbi:beta-L-arabinofuranosidase domain-containing protein [Flavobacterium sp. RSSB_23]|uniref:beta-L-arabinofuranosidase domain-containing protein n=1 Tax=Flavobacterium sp. RSSB_23 TaxID=3447668 RepID=UPI003F2C6A2B